MKIKNKKGISLIVLSITILVMAILAATVIIALEDSGIIGRSKNTVKNNNYSDEYTRLVVIKNGILTDNLGTITVDEFVTELQNKGLIESGITTNANGSKTVTTKTGFTVIVSQNGTSDLSIVIDGYTPPSSNVGGNNTGNGDGNSGNNTGNGDNNSGNTSPYSLSGVWTFNSLLTVCYNHDLNAHDAYEEEVNFKANGINYTKMHMNYTSYYYITLVYMSDTETTSAYYEDFSMCNDNLGCGDEEWYENGTVDFGSTPQAVSEEFYKWFTSNATQGTTMQTTVRRKLYFVESSYYITEKYTTPWEDIIGDGLTIKDTYGITWNLSIVDECILAEGMGNLGPSVEPNGFPVYISSSFGEASEYYYNDVNGQIYRPLMTDPT